MISWGVLGLLDAIETYDPERRKKAKFESFAISKIRWAILDELRGQDWVPRRVRTRAREVERAKAKLSQDLLRPPTEGEVAEEVDMGVEEYRGFLDQYSRAQVASLEARLDTESGTIGEYRSLLVDASAPDPQSQANLEELRAHLIDAIDGLEEQERLVATFYLLLRGAYPEGDRQSHEPHGGPHQPAPQTRPGQAARAPQELPPRLRRWRLARESGVGRSAPGRREDEGRGS